MYPIAYLFFSLISLQIANDRENAKRKRLKSTDSDHRANPSSSSSSLVRSKVKKLDNAQSSEQKEDGEISDDNDDSADDDDDYRVRSASPVHQRRKQIVYEIDDDSYSSSGSGRNSTHNSYSGEELSKHNKY